MNKVTIVILLNLFLAIDIQAQEETNSEAYQLSIDDLLNTRVNVGSNKNESISSSPGIVSTIKMESLFDYGVLTLKDALSYVPGVVVQEETLGTTTIMIRGLADTWNQKTLFLLDGIPFWMPAQGEYPILGLPVSLIERIEIIRGPGSVLYGTNASGGIINVVLKKDSDSKDAMIQSNFNLGMLNGNIAYTKKLKKGSLYMDISAQTMTNGWKAEYQETILTPPFNTGDNQFQNADGKVQDYRTSGSHMKKEEFFNFTAGLKVNKLNFMSSFLSQTQNGLGGVAVIEHTNKINYKGLLNHIDYTINTSKVDINLYADYGILFHKINADNFLITNQTVTDTASIFQVNPITFEFDQPFKNNYRLRTGVNSIYHISEKGNILLGFENEIRNTGQYQLRDATDNSFVSSLGEPISVNEFAVLAQVDYQFNKLRVILGGRYVNNEFAGSRFLPRASMIYNFNKKSSIKALFSSGFNSPALTQQITLDIPFVIKGRRDLKAETVRSFDLAYSYATTSQIFVVNAFYLATDNIINLDFTKETPEYDNFSGFNRWGLELDYQKTFKSLNIFSNITYNNQGNEIITDDFFARFVPKFTLNLGAKYKLSENHSLAISGKSIGKRGRENYKANSITLFNLAYNYEFKKYKASIIMNNLTNGKIEHPDVTRNSVPLVPGGPGRTLSIMFRCKI